MKYNESQKELALRTYDRMTEAGSDTSEALNAASKASKIPKGSITAYLSHETRRKNKNNRNFRSKLTEDVAMLAMTYVQRKNKVTKAELARRFTLSNDAVSELVKLLQNQNILVRTRPGFRVVKTSNSRQEPTPEPIPEIKTRDLQVMDLNKPDNSETDGGGGGQNSIMGMSPEVLRMFGAVYYRHDVRVVDLD